MCCPSQQRLTRPNYVLLQVSLGDGTARAAVVRGADELPGRGRRGRYGGATRQHGRLRVRHRPQRRSRIGPGRFFGGQVFVVIIGCHEQTLPPPSDPGPTDPLI